MKYLTIAIVLILAGTLTGCAGNGGINIGKSMEACTEMIVNAQECAEGLGVLKQSEVMSEALLNLK